MHHFIYILLPVLALTLLVQLYLKAVYSRYSRVPNRQGLTGAEAARQILRAGGIHGVRVEEVSGFLTDHYDPIHQVLRLSPANYRGNSIAAVGVAAHEAGHAIQHAQGYAPLALRNLAVPIAGIGSNIGYLVLFLGLATSLGLALLGVALIAGVAVFQLINLPVEFDASRRALMMLPQAGILTRDETREAQAVLRAAALTYVAATVAAVWEVLYWLMRLGVIGGGSRDE
ncbi:MAG: zinc metallopeptidase [Planctomycetes bacterium]|nr:zinc metallopeptidase [Planctomycetota bacterium]